MNSETLVVKTASAFGTLMILAWFAFLGPLGVALLLGVAYSMLCDNSNLTTFLIGLVSLPVSLTVLWGTLSGLSLSEIRENQSSIYRARKVKMKV